MTSTPPAVLPVPAATGAPTARELSYAAFVRQARPALGRTALLLAGGDAERGERLVRGALTRLYLVWPWVGPHGPLARTRQLLLDTAVAEEHRLPAPPASPGVPAAPGVLAALAALPPRARLAVVLRDGEHLAEAEVADVLSCSLHSLRRLTADGRHQLRATLPATLPPTLPATLAVAPAPGGGLPDPHPERTTMTEPELTLLLRGAADRLTVPDPGPDDVAGDLDRGRRTLTLVRRRRAVRPGGRLPAPPATRPGAGNGS